MPIKIRIFLLGLVVLGTTATISSDLFPFGMAGLTAFLLAYLSKGLRKHRPKIIPKP
jgi:predicted PurR-regulated permease PerM